jgi:hypothetical protein
MIFVILIVAFLLLNVKSPSTPLRVTVAPTMFVKNLTIIILSGKLVMLGIPKYKEHTHLQ